MLRKHSTIAFALLLALGACSPAPDSGSMDPAATDPAGTSPITITIDPATPGPTINRHLFGQFA
jgi:hypothetical protein